MKTSRPTKRYLILAAFAMACLPSGLRAQEPPTPPEQAPPPAQEPAPAPQPDPLKPAPGGAAYPLDMQIHAAGKAWPFVDNGSPLRFGPLSVASVEYINIYDEFFPSGSTISQDERLNLLRANIDFTLPFKKSLFVLQYTPEVAVLNGQTRTGANGNTGLSIGETIGFTPRFSMTLKDDFGLIHTRQFFPDQFLLIDRQNGGVIQAYFLENPGTRLQNTLTLAFNYKWTPRLTLTVAPGYLYSDTHAQIAQDNYILDDSRVTASLTYALTPHRNIGYIQTVEVLRPIRPIGTRGLFTTSAVFYSEQLSPTWWIAARGAIEKARYPGFQGSDIGFAGTASLLKTFGKSDLALAYSRSSTITTFAVNHQIEEADLLLGLPLTTRLKWTNGIGSYRATGGDPRTSGKYATSSLEFRLPASFSVLGSYSRRNQQSSIPQLLSGNRNTFTFTLRWAPPLLAPQ
jgi:hypothetical protein